MDDDIIQVIDARSIAFLLRVEDKCFTAFAVTTYYAILTH